MFNKFVLLSLVSVVLSADSSITSAPDSTSTDNPYATYPSVPKTASINGFADRIYSDLPKCAQDCAIENESTGMTPCPYWDTGCLCIFPNFNNPFAECVALACVGQEVVVATSLASSICSSAGDPAPYWFIGAGQKAALDAAAAQSATVPPSSSSSVESEITSSSEESSDPVVTSSSEESSSVVPSSDETSSDETSSGETSSGETSSTPVVTSSTVPSSSAASAPIITSSAESSESIIVSTESAPVSSDPSSTGPISSNPGSNTTSIVTDQQTTVVTITSCAANKCSETAVTTGLTTISEEYTTYTTYCPIETKTDFHTTVVTVTSCEDNKCTEVPVTTGVNVVKGLTTTYTTYCPVESELVTKSNTKTTVKPKVITITSCEAAKCQEFPVTESETVLTTEVTSYVTYYPATENSSSAQQTVAPNVVVPSASVLQGSGSIAKPFSILVTLISFGLLI